MSWIGEEFNRLREGEPERRLKSGMYRSLWELLMDMGKKYPERPTGTNIDFFKNLYEQDIKNLERKYGVKLEVENELTISGLKSWTESELKRLEPYLKGLSCIRATNTISLGFVSEVKERIMLALKFIPEYDVKVERDGSKLTLRVKKRCFEPEAYRPDFNIRYTDFEILEANNDGVLGYSWHVLGSLETKKIIDKVSKELFNIERPNSIAPS